MAKFKAVYKCRLCGNVYRSGATTGREVAMRCMVEMNAGISPTVPMAPAMTSTHVCREPGPIGLADFVGWVVEREVTHDG